MDSDLSRREFLERTAWAAGLAGAAGLPASTLLAEAAEAQYRYRPLPRPRTVAIDHFVILMMENRSFDHYFGWLSREADGLQQQTYLDPLGQQVATRHFSTLGSGGVQYKGCGHPDPGHGWNSGRAQLLGGFLAPGSGNDEFALTCGRPTTGAARCSSSTTSGAAFSTMSARLGRSTNAPAPT